MILDSDSEPFDGTYGNEESVVTINGPPVLRQPSDQVERKKTGAHESEPEAEWACIDTNTNNLTLKKHSMSETDKDMPGT